MLGNYVGTSPDGLSVLQNANKGIEVDPGVSATIGGNNTGAGTPACEAACNLISGNNSGGIESYGNVTVEGNWIGVSANGTTALANGPFGGGIVLGGGATIGGATAAKRNVISGLNEGAISIAGAPAGSVTIQGNYMGMRPDGAAAMPNQGSGITINGTNGVQIGGTNAGEGNVISQNLGDGFVVGDAGILLYNGSDGTQIQGNIIGMDAAGTAGFGNTGQGVYVRGSPNTVIGGTTGTTPGGPCTGACNVITNSTGAGVRIDDFNGFFSTGVTVQGNYIGLSPAGSGPFTNNQGVFTDSQGTTIGGTTANARNVIAGSTSHGVVVNGNADDATIQGNYIGTDPGGTVDLGNGGFGIVVGVGALNAQIGGTAAAAGNLISGNQSAGILLNGDDAFVEGNLIGTQADGTSARGNSGDGVSVGGDDNTIGGASASARNVIADNGGDGVEDTGVGTWIQGNYIGVTAGGNTRLGNGGNAINSSATTDTQIGGTAAGAGNVIGGSAIEVLLDSTDGAIVEGNSIGIGADGSSDVGVDSGCACVAAGIKVSDLAEVPSPIAPADRRRRRPRRAI